MSSERQYVLTKLAAGDYLLPSNDAKTLWRIARSTDGPSHGLEDWPRDRTFWTLYRYTGDLHDLDVGDWGQWELFADYLATRTAAIREALAGG